MEQTTTTATMSANTPPTNTHGHTVGEGFCNSQVVDPSACSLEHVLSEFRQYLQSNSFAQYCDRAGMKDIKFEWKIPSVKVTDRFHSMLWPKEGQQRCNNTDSNANPIMANDQDGAVSRNDKDFTKINLGIVFHGTRETNLLNIVENGLDPTLRRGQAYGRGEYFSKDPTLSVSYCKGGNKMMVFCVCVSTSPEWKVCEEQENPKQTAQGEASAKQRALARRRAQRGILKPSSVVVIEENSFQLPLGILEFGSVDRFARDRSMRLKMRLQQLHREAQSKEELAEEARLKTKIIQWIINGETELASKKFAKAPVKFSDQSKLEIAYFAYKRMDEEFVAYYFEELPSKEDCNWESFEKKVVSVETCEGDAKRAWSVVEEQRKKVDSEENQQECTSTQRSFFESKKRDVSRNLHQFAGWPFFASKEQSQQEVASKTRSFFESQGLNYNVQT